MAVVAGALTVSGLAAAGDPLASYRWTSRLLVVLGPDVHDPSLVEQRRLVQAESVAAGQRDLVVIEASGHDERADTLRRRFGVGRGEFRAILVGKDGGAKLASPSPIPAERLFAEIDAMPMRRDEMRRKPDMANVR